MRARVCMCVDKTICPVRVAHISLLIMGQMPESLVCTSSTTAIYANPITIHKNAKQTRANAIHTLTHASTHTNPPAVIQITTRARVYGHNRARFFGFGTRAERTHFRFRPTLGWSHAWLATLGHNDPSGPVGPADQCYPDT